MSNLKLAKGQALVQSGTVKHAHGPILESSCMPAGTSVIRQQFGQKEIRKLYDVLLRVGPTPAQKAKAQRPVGAQRPSRCSGEGRRQKFAVRVLLKC